MSTLRHEVSGRAETAPLVTPRQFEQNIDAIVREFDVVAEEAGMERPGVAELRDRCRQVVDISHDLFGSEVHLKIGRDRELPDWIYFIVDVRTTGTPDEVVARARQWDMAIHRNIGGDARFFCLSFDLE